MPSSLSEWSRSSGTAVRSTSRSTRRTISGGSAEGTGETATPRGRTTRRAIHAAPTTTGMPRSSMALTPSPWASILPLTTAGWAMGRVRPANARPHQAPAPAPPSKPTSRCSRSSVSTTGSTRGRAYGPRTGQAPSTHGSTTGSPPCALSPTSPPFVGSQVRTFWTAASTVTSACSRVGMPPNTVKAASSSKGPAPLEAPRPG